MKGEEGAARAEIASTKIGIALCSTYGEYFAPAVDVDKRISTQTRCLSSAINCVHYIREAENSVNIRLEPNSLTSEYSLSNNGGITVNESAALLPLSSLRRFQWW